MLNGAIKVHPRRAAKMAGRDVVLVDDVLTTGATSDACIRALKETGGARKVVLACFARVVPKGRAKDETPETFTVPGAT